MCTLFEKIKMTKKTDYQSAYRQAMQNSIAVKTHADTVVIYAVTGETINFERSKLAI